MTTIDVDAGQLDTTIAAGTPALIQFWAEWCAPCRAMIPIVDAFAAERGEGITVMRVDIDRQPDLATRFRVTAVPTFTVVKNGDIAATFTGTMPPAAFAAQVDRALTAV